MKSYKETTTTRASAHVYVYVEMIHIFLCIFTQGNTETIIIIFSSKSVNNNRQAINRPWAVVNTCRF